MRTFCFFLLLLFIFLAAGCKDEDPFTPVGEATEEPDIDTEDPVDNTPPDVADFNPDSLWYVLVHRNNNGNPAQPGVHLVDFNSGVTIASYPLPSRPSSPHSLSLFSGNLYLSGYQDGDDIPIAVIPTDDSSDRSVINTQRRMPGAGLEAVDKAIYYGSFREILKIDYENEVLDSFTINRAGFNDLAVSGDYLYYSIQEPPYPVIRKSLETGAENLVGEMNNQNGYAIAIRNDHLFSIQRRFGVLYLQQRSLSDASLIHETPLEVTGWITGLTAYE